ncbi:MAG: AAA-like domain-containing protein [Polyangiales bacterium]
MIRWFNIAGPCYADEHYMIPPERRAGEAFTLVAQGRWFSLVAGRQTGKTTLLRALEARLRAAGDVLALWADLETARSRDDAAVALRSVLEAIGDALTRARRPELIPDEGRLNAWLAHPDTALLHYVRALCEAAGQPVVLLFDEADVLAGAAMVSFLTQLRALYLARKDQPTPQAVVLAGVRAVRDYVSSTGEGQPLRWLGTASPFNITVENVGLAPFTAAEVAELTAQHTAETGQRFEPEAIARVYDLSRGHPWLVNALCDQCTRRDVTDRAVPVTAAHVDAAKETIILERRTHIDSLLARLREERVRRVLDPMIAGATVPAGSIDDDVAYVAGLSLIRVGPGGWEVANPIYREVIPRALTYVTQSSIAQQTAWYVRPDGRLDVPKLMAAWQTFWRKDGHLAAEGFTYKESGPHLMLMAFLQRVVNGGGRVEREYALGKGALDLLVEWRAGSEVQRIPIEVKLRRDTETEAEAVEQVAGYLASIGEGMGWLVMFDLRSTAPWAERLFTRERAAGGCAVTIVGC